MQYGESVTWCAGRWSGSASFSSLRIKHLPASMRAIFDGQAFGAGGAETTGAAALTAVALGEGAGVAGALFIRKNPAPATTIAPMPIPAKSPPFERDGVGDVG